MLPAPLAAFLGVLAAFHTSEFLLACMFMRSELSFSSLLISKPYAIAMGVALLEYLLEAWLLPGLKVGTGGMGYITWSGLALVLSGEVIRKIGMVTAQSNFTHFIRQTHHPDHVLITHGIYRYIRHPGYLGWYMWCVGTQVLLANPLCCAAFAVVAWRFFSERIRWEEHLLNRFFGAAYTTYAACTPTWMPFIP